MSRTDLQLGGGYSYQWECAILLTLEHLLDTTLGFCPEFDLLIHEFLGEVEIVQLEGRETERIELEDINFINGNKAVCVQVKAKEAEGKWWVPSDPILSKALYRFYCNSSLDQDEVSIHFVFLTNRGFNSYLARLKATIASDSITSNREVNHLFEQVEKHVIKNHPDALPLDKQRFNRLLGCLKLIEFLPVEAVEANVKSKLLALRVNSWQEAYDHLYTKFSKGSVHKKGLQISRQTLVDSLNRFNAAYSPSPAAPEPIDAIRERFHRHTETALDQIRLSIPGKSKPIDRDEHSRCEDLLNEGRSVILTGEAGTGKSGISKLLALSAEKRDAA